MNWNDHTKLKGTHAVFSGSNYNWVNYTPEQIRQYIKAIRAKEEGTEMHELASALIKKKISLPPVRKAFNMFVNDAITYNMSSEVVLYYDKHVYGCADAISFEEPSGTSRGVLRISDLKTGAHIASKIQLYCYVAFFCLEYGKDPADIDIYCYIYQDSSDDIKTEYIPTAEEITAIMEQCPEVEKEYMLEEERRGNV